VTVDNIATCYVQVKR